jgi:CDP-paratose 2-epimerase
LAYATGVFEGFQNKDIAMKVAVITGASGLIGAEATRFFAQHGMLVVGIDNNMRKYFFGEGASTAWSEHRLATELGANFKPYNADIRDAAAIGKIFEEYGSSIELVVHTAAQPSHDWAAREPFTDFTVNANGTSVMLEMTRLHAPKAVFIFCSTNKVYGDTPNSLPLVEQETRWDVDEGHPYFAHGIDEDMSIDRCKHSLFGASKVAADVLVQEYGRYFEMRTACFRGGCLTGPGHSGAELHGFLAYLMKCAITGTHYNIFGYKGKQVRDNIHSFDLVNAFNEFYKSPRIAEVYNIGGSRFSNCSMAEAISMCEEITGKKMSWGYKEENRIGDHIWWVSDIRRFQNHYPNWKLTYNVKDILVEIHDELVARLRTEGASVAEKKCDQLAAAG